MATNISQKDMALRAEIAYVDNRLLMLDGERQTTVDPYEVEAIDRAVGELRAVREHMEGRLGYSGGMPLEVPNQSKRAKGEV